MQSAIKENSHFVASIRYIKFIQFTGPAAYLMSFLNIITFILLYQGRPCQLILNLDRGFSMIENASAKSLWTFSFDKLKGSADDGIRFLFLDFGGDDGEIVSPYTDLLYTF